jgi:hypothetical protein
VVGTTLSPINAIFNVNYVKKEIPGGRNGATESAKALGMNGKTL